MRNSFKLTCLLRGLIPPLAFVAILTAPHTGASQTMVQRHDAVADFQKFLPPLPAIPWLTAQPVEGSKSQMRLPEAERKRLAIDAARRDLMALAAAAAGPF